MPPPLPQNHYTTLSLPPLLHPLPPQTLKQAYKRALLLHHPDKNPPSPSSSSHPTTPYPTTTPTIDQITLAYRTLSDPLTKHQYDKSLFLLLPSTPNTANDLDPSQPQTQIPHPHPPAGLETFDLDDLTYSPPGGDNERGEGTWHRSCRCGREEAYLIREGELEEVMVAGEGEEGEILVGCEGCSLWVRVCFAVEGGMK